ncbi:hypothetical protein Cp1R7AA1_133 [Mesorhizobium phage Cp1R7A-A1]|nr:hypothetical protein Cp1R7AA1_133 [Mesorhizobium phage Cp1R7A-A1]
MSQSAKMSMLEAVANTASGYAISVLTYQIVMPLLGFNTSWSDSILLVGVFSAISIVRNFFIRRLFARAAG